MNDIFSKSNVIAVVGVSRDKSKYGYKLFKSLIFYGFKVYPVNPNTSQLDGFTTYPNLHSLPEVPDLVILVVPPKIAKRVVEDSCSIGVKAVWFQPGSEDNLAIKFCIANGVKVFQNMCFVVDGLKKELL